MKYVKKMLSAFMLVIIVTCSSLLTWSCQFGSDYATNNLKTASKKISEEGIVLLKNEDYLLPLDKEKAKISAFSTGSYDMNLVNYNSHDNNFVETLKDYGFKINPHLEAIYQNRDEKYKSNWQHKYGWNTSRPIAEVNELPLKEILKKKDIEKSFNEYNVALFTITRGSGESFDLNNDYLLLSSAEEELLNYLDKKFKDIIVIINSSNQISLKQFKRLNNVKAILNVGLPGYGGDLSIAKILAGEINPSGKLVDTFLYDNLDSPSNINYVQTFDNVIPKIEEGLEWPNEKFKNFYLSLKRGAFKKYIVYQEGIYVGYKYFETRYYDKVMKKSNVGNYDYNSLVKYPVGHGLSYTEFEYNNFDFYDYDKDNNPNTIDIKVDVKNVGKLKGKDSVILYLSKPYTDYDIINNIEKSAIEIVDFKKTRLLNPNETETLDFYIDKSTFKTYDQEKAKTYIDESGKYFFSIGKNVHDALNNKIKRENKNISVPGNARLSLVFNHVVKNQNQFGVDNVTYSTTSGGKKITNIFDKLDFKNYYPNFQYLSRLDWEGTFPSRNSTKFDATNQLIDDLKKEGLEYDYLVNKKNKQSLNGLKSNDSSKVMEDIKFWTIESSRINTSKEYNFGFVDGPQGIDIINNNNKCIGPSLNLLGSSLNKELQEEFGKANGELTEIFNFNFWGGLTLNIHRNYLNGRNYEYISEDNFIVAKTTTNINNGFNKTSNGNLAVLKHFVLNETEENRFGIQTYINEQAFREQYLSIFEHINQHSKVGAIMGSLNRVGTTWASGNIDLIKKYLKNEQKFKGIIMTDAWESGHTYMQQKIVDILNYNLVDIPLGVIGDNICQSIFNEINSKNILIANFYQTYDALLDKYYNLPNSKQNFWDRII